MDLSEDADMYEIFDKLSILENLLFRPQEKEEITPKVRKFGKGFKNLPS